MGLERIIDASQIPLLARVDPVAAMLAGATTAAMHTDATMWATQLRTATRILDGSTMMVDCGIEVVAEALGEAAVNRDGPRWNALLSVIERLTAARDGAVAVLTPGPALLTRELLGTTDDATLARIKPVVVALCEAIAQHRPDLMLLQEATALGDVPCAPAYRRLIGTLRNVVRYFDLPLGIAVGTRSEDLLGSLVALRPDVLLLSADATGTLPTPQDAALLAADVSLVGIPVILTNERDARERVGEARRRLPVGRWCLWTGEALPGETDLAAARALIEELRVT